MTVPLVEPSTDLHEELWQFSHVTYGLLGRIFISACLLAYGLIEAKLLLIIGGLLFLPVLPMIMAISFGISGRQWKLTVQGLTAFALSTLVLFLGGIVVALLSRPPMRFEEVGVPAAVGVLLSVGVGAAASLAAIDDAGRRELIGLAAASQIGIIPVWLGIVAVFGLPAGADSGEVVTRISSFAANLTAIIVSVTAVQLGTGVIGNISRVKTG